MTENAYKINILIQIEKKIVECLDYDFLTPTAEEFFDLIAEYFNFNEKQKFFGKYFLEASLIDYSLLKYKPNIIAIACCYIVMKYFNLNGIKFLLNSDKININKKDIKNCAIELYILVKNLSKSSLEALKKKYMSDKFLNVADLCEE